MVKRNNDDVKPLKYERDRRIENDNNSKLEGILDPYQKIKETLNNIKRDRK